MEQNPITEETAERMIEAIEGLTAAITEANISKIKRVKKEKTEDEKDTHIIYHLDRCFKMHDGRANRSRLLQYSHCRVSEIEHALAGMIDSGEIKEYRGVDRGRKTTVTYFTPDAYVRFAR